jgi:hypothetical protein
VSYGPEPRLFAGEGSDADTRPTVPYGPRASCIKKDIAGLPMQLGSRVSKTCLRVLRRLTPEPLRHARRMGRWHHHDLQDMRTSDYNTTLVLLTTYKTQLQCEATRQDGAYKSSNNTQVHTNKLLKQIKYPKS